MNNDHKNIDIDIDIELGPETDREELRREELRRRRALRHRNIAAACAIVFIIALPVTFIALFTLSPRLLVWSFSATALGLAGAIFFNDDDPDKPTPDYRLPWMY